MKTDKLTVFVGLSGGVDSSVAAALLLDQGYEVIGVYMKNWSSSNSACCTTDQDAADARLVAEKLGIKFQIWNFEKEYQEQVMKYFFAEYEAGRTPNPDVVCNREIKFKLFLERAISLGADKVATGHYARVTESDGHFHLLKGLDSNKDQSYFLCQLQEAQLSRVLFPVGNLTKPEVRRLATKRGLVTAQKKDSQGLCFVGQINVREFLKTKIKPTVGEIVNRQGKHLGQHEGLAYYTLGQREGIGNLPGGPYYVVAKDMANNKLIVSSDPNDEILWRRTCIINGLSFIAKPLNLPANAEVSVRYRHRPVPAELLPAGPGEIKLEFARAERAITPGQLAVIYQGDELLGSGVII